MAKKKIARDDGHGLAPLTPGKRTPFIPEIGRFIPENEFNREVSRLLGIELERCGFDTIDTAPGDADHSLASRVKRANDAKADLFISIHYNAFDGTFGGKNPEGFSAHIDPSGGQSLKFAQIALKHLAKGTQQVNRGVVKQQLYVTANTKMPAVLFELGFMDNNREALLMIDKSFQKECAQEIAMAVCEFYNVKYVPEKTAVVVRPPASLVKLGTATMLREVPVYASAKFGTQTGDKIAKGKALHIYAIKNGWYQLFSGEWIPSNYGKNFSFVEVKKTEPPKPAAPKPTDAKPPATAEGNTYRVKVDGKQVGAYANPTFALAEVEKALKSGKKKVELERV